MLHPSISFNDPNFKTKVVAEMVQNGLVVINDIYSDPECTQLVGEITDQFCNLFPGLNKQEWSEFNLPSQTRPGLFQQLVSNLQPVWNIRSNEKIASIFKHLYSTFRGREINDFICSGDGINVRGNVGPLHTSSLKDWAHCDQTLPDDIYQCIQGQVVLTKTTASFVASPKSHTIFHNILDRLGDTVDYTTQWLQFNTKQLPVAQKLVKEAGGQWQIPILAKKGSLILWLSTTIHSAKLQDRLEPIGVDDKYLGWRCVVYVCYRPKEEFTLENFYMRQQAFEHNLSTNHWGATSYIKLDIP